MIAVCLLLLTARVATRAADDDATAPPPEGVVALVELLGQVDDAAFQLDLLKGINEGLKGRRSVTMPKAWTDVYKKLAKSENADVREQSRKLALVFGDPAALAELRAVMMNAKAPLDARRRAMASLLAKKAADLAPALQTLATSDAALRADALRGLAAYDHADTPAIVLKLYPSLNEEQKRDALDTLASRLAYAKALMATIEGGDIAAGDVAAETIRKLRLYKDAALQQSISKLWTVTRATPQEKQDRIAKLKALLMTEPARQPELSQGRALFAKTCAQCHTLFDAGGRVGPDLTGSGRANLDYILLNVVDPQATVGRDYFTTVIESEDGQQIVGIVAAENDNAVTMRTANGEVLVPKKEIITREVREMSMMPEGLLDRFKEDELRDLIAYLASPVQVELPKQ